MKKYVAAILLIVFITAQYGKVSSYYHCVLINAVKTDPVNICDCQQILLSDPAEESDKNDAAVPFHTHSISTDEYFVKNSLNLQFGYPEDLARFHSIYNNHYYFSLSKPPFTPPEC